MQRNKINFEGQKIFIGIDVHKTTWEVASITESGVLSRHPQVSSAQVLFDFLSRRYPGGEYHAVYEAGFSGFSTYYSLVPYGIDCIVIHAADVPTTQYEKAMKTDRIDAEKLARSLRAGLLRGIYVRGRESLDDLSVSRIRKGIQQQLSGCKCRVKHMLHCNGVAMPERFERPGSHWSRAFIRWLKEDVRLLSPTRTSLDLLISQVESTRANLLEATMAMRDLSRGERYSRQFNLIMTVPGIGFKTAMCILTEVCDIDRFSNEREFAAYLGLIPTCHNSGEKTSNGEKTFRGNKHLGPMLVEASWVAITRDEGLGLAYSHFKERMEPQKAIIRIARKMSNIIFSLLKTGNEYVPYA
jgi:transposase